MHRYADIIRRVVIAGAYLGGAYFNLMLGGHKDFPESRWSNLGLLAADVVCWLVAWVVWLDGAWATWRRTSPGLDPKGRDRFFEARVLMVLLLILGTLYGLVPGAWHVAHSDY